MDIGRAFLANGIWGIGRNFYRSNMALMNMSEFLIPTTCGLSITMVLGPKIIPKKYIQNYPSSVEMKPLPTSKHSTIKRKSLSYLPKNPSNSLKKIRTSPFSYTFLIPCPMCRLTLRPHLKAKASKVYMAM